MSYVGWDGRDDLDAANNLLAASDELKHAGINQNLLIAMNDSGISFDEIANYLNSIGK
jgi:hypothetical protein